MISLNNVVDQLSQVKSFNKLILGALFRYLDLDKLLGMQAQRVC